MTFDPDSITPSEELLEECISNPGSIGRDCTLAARWGAAQAVKALRHQWPEPITDRPPAEEDADECGFVQYLFAGKWNFDSWDNVAKNQHQAWLHTANWRPMREPTLKERAPALLDSKDFDTDFTTEQIALLRQVVESAPDATP
jgi:hypothetical protein